MPTILIIEDNELNLTMVKDLLELAGYFVLEAQEGQTGIELARKHLPDLILLDLYLPGLHGYDLIRILKSDSELHTIPVVAFSASVMIEEQQKAIEMGCSAFIAKPIIVEHFVETISRQLRQKAGLKTP